MTIDAETALTATLVRLNPQNPIGAGFVVTEHHILTCAHCVKVSAIDIDWPLLPDHPRRTAQVVSRDAQADVAVLEVADLPVGAAPAALFDAGSVWVHTFRTFGFPQGHPDGVWATGHLLGPNAAGWVELEDVKETGKRVEPGFSGGPVWDDDLGGVAGMVVAADRDAAAKVAFMIPAVTLAHSAGLQLAPPPSRSPRQMHSADGLSVSLSGDDQLIKIQKQFQIHTDRTLRQVATSIRGLPNPIGRPEVKEIEEQLAAGHAVVVTGEAGTGKSAIGGILALNGRQAGMTALFVDARRLASANNDTDLRQHFDLGESLASAIRCAGGHTGCRVIVDQLDSIVGSSAAQLLADLAVESGQNAKGVQKTQESRIAFLWGVAIDAGCSCCTASDSAASAQTTRRSLCTSSRP